MFDFRVFTCKFFICLASGRLSSNVIMTGNVLLNGKKRRLDYGLVVSTFKTQKFIGFDHLMAFSLSKFQIIPVALNVSEL